MFFLAFADFETFFLLKMAWKITVSYISIIKYSTFPGSAASSSNIPSASHKRQRKIHVDNNLTLILGYMHVHKSKLHVWVTLFKKQHGR